MQKWQCRIAPSLGGGFAGTPNEVWGTRDYEDDTDPTVFFGMYGLPDFYALWRHKGIKAILWAGSDIRHLVKGYFLNDVGTIRLDPEAIVQWIDKECINFCENWVEQKMLKRAGIDARICPSFLGNVDDYPLLDTLPEKQIYYSSVSGNDFELYGWDKINKMAAEYPDVEFHLYGNTEPWNTQGLENVIVHGRVSQEQMNEEIRHMTGAVRMTEFDGFSEILAKSVLWGQWPISLIHYPFMDSEPKKHEGMNVEGREAYLHTLNRFPWNVHLN